MVRARGGGGGGGDEGTSKASANRAWAESPSHSPSLPLAPFPNHSTWSTLGQSRLDRSPATAKDSKGGSGIKVGGVALVPGSAGITWWRLVATMSRMSPLFSSLVPQRTFAASPRAVPACTRTW